VPTPKWPPSRPGRKTWSRGEDGTTLFLTDPTDLDLVSRALPAQGFTVLSAKLGYKPKNPIDAGQPERRGSWKRWKPSWPRSTTTKTCRTSLPA
jgi:hypothetical protein